MSAEIPPIAVYIYIPDILAGQNIGGGAQPCIYDISHYRLYHKDNYRIKMTTILKHQPGTKRSVSFDGIVQI